jgi:hypothetical protein
MNQIVSGGKAVAKKDKEQIDAMEPELNMENIKRRLDLLDQRLDNIDSSLSAVVERIMNQPLTLNITCPRCGRNIEIAVVGGHKITA